jgi:hypothetical protein
MGASVLGPYWWIVLVVIAGIIVYTAVHNRNRRGK